jgi:hypothetical protein
MTMRLGFWFAFTGYLLTVLYYFGPFGIAYSVPLYRILPFWMCIITDHGMPVSAVALFIAPINAAIVGAVGALVGLVVLGLSSKLRSGAKAKTTPPTT